MALNRVEKYKMKRIRRYRCFAAAVLFSFLLIAGILTVDQATNNLIAGKDGFAIAAFKSNENNLEITFMNRKIYINTEYLNRDLKRLKNLFK